MQLKLNLTPEQHIKLYYFMQLDRQLEDRLAKLFRQDKIHGGLYSSLGQEAVSVGAAFALEQRDWLAPMVRNIGALLVKGFKPRDVFTQHMARLTSPTQGKDGTSHFGDLKVRHVVSPTSMLGDLIPVMTGVAMAGRYLGQNIVAMTWIGDGGSSTGAFHEGLNMAASQRAPLVLIVENNQWAYSTPVSRQVPLKNLADRAVAYGISSRIVDGNDVVAMYETAKTAMDECRAGRGPFLIEAKTMRMQGHAQHDSAEYVPKEMFEYWKSQDPIARYEAYLTQQNLWDADKKAEIDALIERELDEDQKFAEESPMPSAKVVQQGVYCEGCHTIEAEWHRPQEELMPPASSVEAVWKITDFGALRHADTGARPQVTGGNGAKVPQPVHVSRQPNSDRSSQPHQKHAQRHSQPPPQQQAQTNTKLPVAPDAEVPIRVPFGRGPKDKSFELNQRDKSFARNMPEKPRRKHHGPKRRGN